MPRSDHSIDQPIGQDHPLENPVTNFILKTYQVITDQIFQDFIFQRWRNLGKPFSSPLKRAENTKMTSGQFWINSRPVSNIWHLFLVQLDLP